MLLPEFKVSTQYIIPTITEAMTKSPAAPSSAKRTTLPLGGVSLVRSGRRSWRSMSVPLGLALLLSPDSTANCESPRSSAPPVAMFETGTGGVSGGLVARSARPPPTRFVIDLNAAANSPAVRNRALRSFSSPLAITMSSSGDNSGRRLRTRGAVWVTCWNAIDTEVSPVNSGVPVTISKSTTAVEYRSLRPSMMSPFACSGEKY
ncbi:unannotated protein [freshwater metagenome]|uniref:Unannotated protein n=1 Tax=freshwater metagenome TaxID=449393 RepID=A0A6J7CNP0_9ZZZZ